MGKKQRGRERTNWEGCYEVQKRKRLSLDIKKSWGFRTRSIGKTDWAIPSHTLSYHLAVFFKQIIIVKKNKKLSC